MIVYISGVLVSISIFAILAASLDLLIGFTGLFTIAQAAVFGIGAYTSALTAQWFGTGFWFGLLAAALAGAAISFLISLPALRNCRGLSAAGLLCHSDRDLGPLPQS